MSLTKKEIAKIIALIRTKDLANSPAVPTLIIL